MLASRSAYLGRAIRQLITRKTVVGAVQQQGQQRLSHAWSYRTAAPPASKATLYTAEAVSAGMWWWVLWHLWHEYEHITGEFDYPDPSKWTDAELGIPKDH